jgi:hypothetical protein
MELGERIKLLHTHRFVFLAAWLAGVIALWVFPGYEARAFVMGGIIGYWPFVLFGVVGEPATWIAMFAFSAIEIGLCAWFMDRSCVPRKMWAVLLFNMVVGMAIAYLSTSDDFEHWKCGLVSHGFHPDYEISTSDFRRLYVIPQILSAGVWAIYLTTVIGVVYAIGLRVWGSKPKEESSLKTFIK